MLARCLAILLIFLCIAGCRRSQPNVEVEEKASLELTIESTKVQVEPGLSTRVKVGIARKNLAEAFKLELTDLPSGLSAGSVNVGAGDTSAEIELTAAPGTLPGQRAGLRAVANAGGVRAESPPFGVTILKPSFTCVYEPTALKIPKGMTRDVKVTVQRAKDAYQGEVALSIAGDKHITATSKDAGDKPGDARVFTIKAAADAPEGKTQVLVHITGGRETRGVAILPITVLGTPFVLSAAPNPVKAIYGHSAKVTVNVKRGDYLGEIKLQLEGVPPQWLPKSMSIQAKQSTTDIELRIPSEAQSMDRTVQIRGLTDDGRSAGGSFDLTVEGRPFTIRPKEVRFEIAQGASKKLTVLAERSKDFTGSIELKVRKLPGSVTGDSLLGISAKAKDGVIEFKVDDAAALGPTPNIQIVGIATIGDEKREFVFEKFTLVVLPQFALHVKPGKIAFVEGQKATLRVSAERRNYQGAIDVKLKNLPTGVTADEARIGRDMDFVDIVLTAGPGSKGMRGDVQAIGATVTKKEVASGNFSVEVISKLFELEVDKAVKVTMGTKTPLKVIAKRLDYDGPISVELKGLPKDLTAPRAVIPAGQKEIVIDIAAADLVKEGKIDVHILGIATAKGEQRTSPTIQLEIVPGFFDLKIEPALVNLHHGGMGKITVTALRKGFDGPISVELKNLPVKVGADKVTIPKGENKVEIELKAGLTLVEGAKVDVFARASAANKSVDSSRITIHLDSIGQPTLVELKVAPTTIKLTAGGTAKVKVSATRKGYTGPIAVELKNLPADVESSKGMIAEGEKDVEITLTAKAKAAAQTKLDVCAVGLAVGESNRAYASPHVSVQVSRK